MTEKEILSLRENIAPVISSLHGSWLGERDGIITARKHKESAVWKNPNDLAILFTAKYYSKYETAAAKASNICVANSEATKNDFCTRYSLSNDWNCEVIHWGIDESLFRPIDHENEDDKSNYKLAREEFLFEEDGLLLLAVGRLAAR